MKLPKFTQPINHTVEKLKFTEAVWEKLKEYKEFYEEVYGHKIEDVTGKQDAMSLFIEKMLESFMKEDKEFNKRKKEKQTKIEIDKKTVVLSHKNETVSTGQQTNKSQGHSNITDSVKNIEKELLGES